MPRKHAAIVMFRQLEVVMRLSNIFVYERHVFSEATDPEDRVVHVSQHVQ